MRVARRGASRVCTRTLGTSKAAPRRRKRGETATLPRDSLRVEVYAGTDPLTGRRNYLTETIPAGPNAATEAEKARTRLLNQVDEQRNPRTKATVNQLMDRYLKLVDVDANTRKGYEFGPSDHLHFAQVVLYACEAEADVVVWLAAGSTFRIGTSSGPSTKEPSSV